MHSPTKESLFHQHFIFDASLKQNLNFKERVNITNKLINELIIKLNMEPLGKLEIYDAVDMNYPGWSFIQPITTSHISGHYFEESDDNSHIHMDVYSCKDFDWKSIIVLLNDHLSLSKWSGCVVTRDMDFTKQKIKSFQGLESSTLTVIERK